MCPAPHNPVERLQARLAGHPNDPDAELVAAYQQDPSLLGALYQARQGHIAEGNLAGAAHLLRQEATIEPDPERRVLLLRELGDLAERHLDDPNLAEKCLRQAQIAAPKDGDVLAELGHLLARHSEPGQGDIDEAQTEARKAEAAELLTAAAGTRQTDETQRGWLFTALELDPGQHDALSLLEAITPMQPPHNQSLAPYWVGYLQVCPDGPTNTRRRMFLARAYMDSRQWDDAAFCLEAGLKAGLPKAQELAQELEGLRSGLQTSRVSLSEPSSDASDLAMGRQPSIQPSSISNRPQPSQARDAAAHEPQVVHTRTIQEAPSSPPANPKEVAAIFETFSRAMVERRKSDAAYAARRLVSLVPEHREAFNYLDAHLRRSRDHQGRTDLLEHTGTQPTVPRETRVLRLREAAGLRESRLKDLDGAVALWQHIAQLDPDSDEPLRNLKRLSERLKRWNQVASELEQELATTDTAATRLPILKRLCTLHVDQRLQPDSAIAALQALLQLEHEPQREETLCGLLVQQRRYREALPLLEKRVEQSQGEARIAVLTHIAELHTGPLANPEMAYATYERALAEAPSAESANATVLRMMDIDHAAGNHARVIALLRRQLEVASSPDLAVDLILRIAETAEQGLGDVETATTVLTHAADEYPEQPGPAAALISLLERRERYEDLVEFLRERSIIEKRPERRADLMLRTAQILEDNFNDIAGATAVLESMLRSRPDDRALARLEFFARSNEDLPRLAEILTLRIKFSQFENHARSMRNELASLLANQLGRPKEAIDLVLTLLSHKGEDSQTELLEVLETACRATHQYEVLSRTWEKQLKKQGDETQAAQLAQKLSALYQTDMPNRRMAVAALLRWNELVPNALQPLQELRPLLESQRAYPALLKTLDALARLSGDGAHVAETTLAAAKLCSGQLDDPQGAWQRLQPLAEAGHDDALQALEPLAVQLGNLPELCRFLEAGGHYTPLVQVLLRAAESAHSPAQEADYFRRAANTQLERLHDPASAVRTFEALLAIQEDGEALTFLLSQARENDAYEQAAEYLGRLAELESDTEAKAGLYIEQGNVLTHELSRHGAGALCYENALQLLGPDHEPVLEALAYAYREVGDHAALVRILGIKLERATDTANVATLSHEIATLAEGPLKDPQTARYALFKWAQADTAAAEPLRRVRNILSDGTENESLLQVLDALTLREIGPADQIEAALAAATLVQQTHNDIDGAFERLRPFITHAQPDVDAALSTLAHSSAEMLTRYCTELESCKRHDELAQQLEQALRQSNAAAALPLRQRAARLYAGTLDLPADAERHYRAILEEEENEEALRYLRAQAMQADDPRLLCQFLGRLGAVAEHAGNTEAVQALRFEQAHLLRARLDDTIAATNILNQILEQTPSFAAALDELSSCYRQTGDLVGLADCHRKELEQESNPRQQALIAERLYRLHAEQRNSPQDGKNALLAWHNAAPADVRPLRHLLALADTPEQAGERVTLLDQLSELESNPEACTASRAAAGIECAGPVLDDLEGAFARLSPLLSKAHSPADEALLGIARRHGALDRLCAQYETQARYDELAALLSECAETATTDAQRIEAYRKCATVFREQLDDALATAEAYRQLLTLTDDLPALEFLTHAARQAENANELEPLLQQLAAQSEDEAVQRQATLERAHLLATELNREPEAIATLRAQLESTPHDAATIAALALTAEAANEPEALSQALRARLQTSLPSRLRAECAEKLASVHDDDGPLPNGDHLRHALERWAEADPSTEVPLARLCPLLANAGDPQALLQTLDRRVAIAATDEARDALLSESATLCAGVLNKPQEAFNRLSQAFIARLPLSDERLQSIAQSHALHKPLAQLLIARAQATTMPAAATTDWLATAALYRDHLKDDGSALEAALRGLAASPGEVQALTLVEQLAATTDSLGRLQRVYEKLIRELAPQSTAQVTGQAEPHRAEQSTLCHRASHFFEQAQDLDRALHWAMTACRLAPTNQDNLARAEQLASGEDAAQDLIWLSETRIDQADDGAQRCAALLAHTALAQNRLDDEELATATIRTALQVAGDDAGLRAQVWTAAQQLDETRPQQQHREQHAEVVGLGAQNMESDTEAVDMDEVSVDDTEADTSGSALTEAPGVNNAHPLGMTMRRAVVQGYQELANGASPDDAANYNLKAAELLKTSLNDARGSYDLLRKANSEYPANNTIYGALEAAAIDSQRLDGLDAHLCRLAKKADGDALKAKLLIQRGELLAEHLDRFDTAARVFREVIALSERSNEEIIEPEEIADRLEVCLRKAQRYQELLKVYDAELNTDPAPARRLHLLRARAALWEQNMSNRVQARLAWQQVLDVSPGHPEAEKAMHRLG